MLFQDISPEKIFNFLNEYFWKNLNLRSLLVMFVFDSPLKYGFKTIYIHQF